MRFLFSLTLSPHPVLLGNYVETGDRETASETLELRLFGGYCQQS